MAKKTKKKAKSKSGEIMNIRTSKHFRCMADAIHVLLDKPMAQFIREQYLASAFAHITNGIRMEVLTQSEVDATLRKHFMAAGTMDSNYLAVSELLLLIRKRQPDYLLKLLSATSLNNPFEQNVTDAVEQGDEVSLDTKTGRMITTDAR